jgi:hypothetical protein
MSMIVRQSASVPDPCARARVVSRLAQAIVGVALLAWGAGCGGPPPVDFGPRIQKATSGLDDDPTIQAREAEVEAAVAREEGEVLIDEIQLRVGDEYDNEHQIRVAARLPVNRPNEVRARREVRRAETEVAVARLEEASLERRAELCFPSVDLLAYRERVSIYDAYVERQEALLAWSEEWRRSGVVDELSAARFKLESRLKSATREPLRAPPVEVVLPVLPEVGRNAGLLVQGLPMLRERVSEHHPSVAVRRAMAERYRALVDREDSQRTPRLRFLEIAYERDTGRGGRDGVGGRVAVDFPFGARERANANRYEALVRQEQSEERRLIAERVGASLEALGELSQFEARADRWAELESLAGAAERLADRWWRERLARPAQVAGLLDGAFTARSAVLDARERAGIAGCTLLATTGVPPEHWPRE